MQIGLNPKDFWLLDAMKTVFDRKVITSKFDNNRPIRAECANLGRDITCPTENKRVLIKGKLRLRRLIWQNGLKTSNYILGNPIHSSILLFLCVLCFGFTPAIS